MTLEVQYFEVSINEENQRLDNYLSSRLKGVPKSALYRIIRQGQVRVNKGRAKPDRKLAVGDLVRVPPIRVADPKMQKAPGTSLSEALNRSVLLDQEGLVIINKPSGLAVHGGSGVSLGLIEALRQLPEFKGFLELIHRLDKETSGCIMVARKRSTLHWFQSMLRERRGIKKRYIALVQGTWPDNIKDVDAPLKRFVLGDGSRLVRVRPDGKEAHTRFRVLERLQDATLVEAMPLTGRTHQIRVHASYVGCPLVGDLKYGETSLNSSLARYGFNRLFLHAASLQFSFPDGVSCSVSAALPLELENALDRLRRG